MRILILEAATSAGLLGLTIVPLTLIDAAAQGAEPPVVTMTIDDKGCQPMELTVPPTRVKFVIRNNSHRSVEWEILQGSMVVEERENIIPSFASSLTTKLDPAEYAMTCGLLSNPKGKLIVRTAARAEDEEAGGAGDIGRAIATYKTYVAEQVDAMVVGTRTLVDAVKSGKLDAARQAYAPAHLYYERVEPVAEVFNDLDKSMDSRADDYEKKEKDPNFSGFHRIEYGLFSQNTTQGLDGYADRLMKDVEDLKGRVASLKITPKVMVGGAAELIEEVASKKISGEEDRYSKTDLWDFQANIDGAQKIVGLLRPDIRMKNPQLIQRIESNFKSVDSKLAVYRAKGGGFESYDALKPDDQRALKGPITVLAEDLSKLRGTLGIE